jgi:hypothetical protein
MEARMTRDEIFEMARQADIRDSLEYDHMECNIESLEAFAKLVAQHEREACADIAENWNSNGMPRTGVANEIRARQ